MKKYHPDGCRLLAVPPDELACEADCKYCPLFKEIAEEAFRRPWWHKLVALINKLFPRIDEVKYGN